MKLMSVVLMVALALSGPLAPLAWAQEKSEDRGDGAWAFGAAVANAAYVPGKVVLCGVGAVSGVVVLLITFGSQYGAAARAWEEGCRGPWTLSAADLKPKEAEDLFYTDRPGYKQSDYQKTN